MPADQKQSQVEVPKIRSVACLFAPGCLHESSYEAIASIFAGRLACPAQPGAVGIPQSDTRLHTCTLNPKDGREFFGAWCCATNMTLHAQ